MSEVTKTNQSVRRRYRTNSGMALLMAMIIMPIILVLAVSFVDPIVRSYRATVTDQKTLLVKNVAQNVVEEALLASKDAGTGELTEGKVKLKYDFGNATGQWKVMGTPSTDPNHLIDKYYTIPAPGSGTAGGDYCSTREPVVTQTALDAKLSSELGIDRAADLGTDYNPFEWPCHWNKLHEGESVAIPLYSEDSKMVYNPGFSLDKGSGFMDFGGGIGLDDFELTVRAACKPSLASHGNEAVKDEICNGASGERYVLDVVALDEITVLWEISGEELDKFGKPTGRTVYLGPYYEDFTKNSYLGPPAINSYYMGSGSPITLNQNSQTEDNIESTPREIIQFLHNDPITNPVLNIHKPVLKLISIHSLRENGARVPYVEYQFKAQLQSGSIPPIANVSKIVEVDIMVDGGYSEKVEKTISLPAPVTGFVIQQ